MQKAATTEPTGPVESVHDSDPGADRLVYRDRINPADTAVPVVIGRTTDFFTFSVYAIASVLVFPRVFFPADDLFYATTLSFAVFSLAFFFRPLGTFFFNLLGQYAGRAAKLTAASLLLGGSTMAIAFIPPYAQVGILAPLMLVAMRIGQGLGLGGSGDGWVLLLTLNAPRERRAWYGMLPQIGASTGFLLAVILFMVLMSNLSSAEFLDWGWRFPFFIVLVLNIVSLWARLRLLSTPDLNDLERRGELTPRPLTEVVSNHWREIILAMALVLCSFALFHMVSIFPLSWGVIGGHMPALTILGLQLCGAAICLLFTLMSGWLADIYGRKALVAAAAGLTAVYSLAATGLLDGGTASWAVYLFVGYAILGLSFGQTGTVAASLFPPRYRYTGAAFVSDMAWLTGAAFAPLIAFVLAVTFGVTYAGYYLLSGAVVTLIATFFWTRQPDLESPGRDGENPAGL